MKVIALFDVLSHWCLAAWPAFERARAEIGTENVDLLLAPIANGFPMGMHAEHVRWYYTRGTRAYGMTLHADWYESDRTTTLWANAAVVAASLLGADLAHTAHAVMRAGMEDGELVGRRDVAIDVTARIANVDPGAIAGLIDGAQVGRKLNEANALLAQMQCAERPSWQIENANGDRATLQGVWQENAIAACIDALRADERAYAEAGAPPF